MSATELLAMYERVADAPDAVGKLRKFVLDLAVRGKLVEQDETEEPASELLERIALERRRLIESRQLKREVFSPPLEEYAVPFSLPVGWAWTRLGAIIHLVSGQHLQPGEYSDAVGNGLPYITGPSDFSSVGLRITKTALVRKAVAKRGQLLLTVKGSGVGKSVSCDIEEVAISRQLMALTAILWDSSFLALVMHLVAQSLRYSARSLIPGIAREDVESFVVGLPPLAEQHRIVAKVDELMALCDQLEAARTEREAARDRLAAASLARLNAPDPDTFQADARFALNVLAALSTRPEQVKQLRQTILNLAVRGKLVAQDPSDEPASELLRRISIERALGAKGRAHLGPPPQAASAGGIDLPAGWIVAPLGEVASKITDGAHKTPTYVREGIPFVSVKDFSAGILSLEQSRRIPPHEHAALYRRCDPRRGDILIGRIGTLGRAVLVDTDVEFSLFVSVGLIRFSHANLAPQYLRFLLNSPLVEAEFNRIKIGGATHTNKVNLGDLHTVQLPIPPLAEQNRIVAKLEEMMALCDQLEASLHTSDFTRSCLLSALLHETLVPHVSVVA